MRNIRIIAPDIFAQIVVNYGFKHNRFGGNMLNYLYEKFYPTWKHNWATSLKKRRLLYVNNILGGRLFDKSWLNGKKILDIGCSSGADFLQFFKDVNGVNLTGIDILPQNIQQSNVTFLQMDAEVTHFQDKSFDLTVSIGVLEHIEPIEKLSKVIAEIDRISKEYVIIVPNISTFLEPHTVEFFWQLRSMNKKKVFPLLNYFSDEAWLQFTGFSDAEITRFAYIPGLIKNTIIAKRLNM
jgi:SAM-dependent methyltransferase